MGKAQSATEYLVALSGLFIVVLLVLNTVYDIPEVLSSATKSDNQRFWANAEVGVLYAYTNGTHTAFAIRNNQRESISINSITLGNDVLIPANLSVSPLISGFTGIYVINQSEVGSEYLGINYTMPVLGLTRYFDAGSKEYGFESVIGNLSLS